MIGQHLHIITFDVPYPANYGGAIDVYYRIKALHAYGVHIILHCFHKDNIATRYPELESLCEKVHYYQRSNKLFDHIHFQPFVVRSRRSKDLLNNLLQDNFPILFEGLVSCYLINHPLLHLRKKYFRECNVEHDYYYALGKATSILWKKIFYFSEAIKLYFFQSQLKCATKIFALAHQDENYFKQTFPNIPVVYIPCFHANEIITSKTGTGKYILYHGNLAVPENELAATHIIQHLADRLSPISLIIAGSNPTDKLRTLAEKKHNISLVTNPTAEEMEQLIQNAQIHLLITNQPTGLKLKLLNVLYQGRHIVVNPHMVAGTELYKMCHIGQDDNAIIQLCHDLYPVAFTETDISKRIDLLHIFDNNYLISKLTEVTF